MRFSIKQIRVIFLCLLLASLAAGYAYRALHKRPVDEQAALARMLPGETFAEKGGTPPLYRSSDGTIAFNSSDLVSGIRGYAGPIMIMLALKPDGRIAGIRLLEHRETKSYVHYMETPDYLSRFIGRSVRDLLEPDKDIDAITRATVSVGALARTVRESSRRAARSAYNIDVQGTGRPTADSVPALSYALLFGLCLAAYGFTGTRGGWQRLRDAALAGGIIVVGVFLSSPFSVLHVFNLLLLRPSSALLWYLIVPTTLLSVLFVGRFYCGWLCPFGAISEFLSRLPFRKWTIPADLDGPARNLKYLLLGLVAVLVLVTGTVEYGNYETSVTLFSLHGNILSWSLVGITLLANTRIERFWCRYLCPAGAVTGLLAREAAGYPGGKECPMGNTAASSRSECIRCNRCRPAKPRTEAV